VPLRTARDAVIWPFEHRYLEAALRHHGGARPEWIA
jgi:hypothetical protein